ncbi:UDP-glycosyltransferase 73C1-like isoform X2 [Rhodamnia argentea]|uniref:Glycosyltransferase n=1 Tax=Rhodamnia argentea TaxID=178133 RepID=A0A8B8NI33_9MYRT|nr:UDP-glycosyltransferase 73C1-like isoform X2 [Rhodamnia argentea]
MDSQYQELHFVLLPHLASGHMIPMMDMARLLARRGLTVTVVTTPINSARFVPVFDRAARSGLRIELLQVPFPSAEAGLPEGCESMDSLPSRGMLKNLLLGISMLRQPVERLLHRLQLRPSCIIADKIVMWADQTAREFGIPRIVFDGSSCFSLVCTHNIVESKVFDTVPESEPFVVPGLPDRIELTRAQLPGAVNIVPSDIKDMRNEIRAKELAAYGVVVNTFEELEPAYIRECRRVRGKVWCIGPVSLCNEDNLDKAERGNKSLVNDDHCLKWLDLWGPSSVIYACLGSLNRLTAPQLIELGLGLEACGRPFIWVVRGGNESRFVDWISESGFEERIEGRGILIRGWAPQVLILSHPAVGGFLTHCGWNSTLEGICAGLPLLTRPLFAEQFYNEKVVVQVLKIGVRLGSNVAMNWGEEEKCEVLMKREEVKQAVNQLMDEVDDGARERRNRAAGLGRRAKMAMEEGGSSYLNMTLMIEDIMQQVRG